MLELLLVKDGQPLGRTVYPGLADGYYIVDSKKAVPIEGLEDLGLYESVASDEVVSPNGHISRRDFYPLLEPGLLVRLFSKYPKSYFLVEGKSDLLERLELWWRGWGHRKFWSGGKTTMLNPRRIVYAKECKVDQVVKVETYVGLVTPPEMCKYLHLEPEMDKVRKIVDSQLGTIGGKVTEIYPYWQRSFPVCQVKFTINGIDPTRGQGCLVYPNGDFYYGPWCQRFGQHKAGRTEMIYDFPPQYTILDWICGPLYEASQRFKKDGYYFSSSQAPLKFEPSNFAIAVYGEDHKGQGDDFARKLRDIDQEQIQIDLEKLKKVLSGAEVSEIKGDFPVLQKWEVSNCLLCASGSGWSLQMDTSGDDQDGKWQIGWSVPALIDPLGLFDTGDGMNCVCSYCTRTRKRIADTAKSFLERLGIKNEDEISWTKEVDKEITWEAIPF